MAIASIIITTGKRLAEIPRSARPDRTKAAAPSARYALNHRCAVRHRYIGACYGAPGLGKTLSARTYAAADDYDQWERVRYTRGAIVVFGITWSAD